MLGLFIGYMIFLQKTGEDRFRVTSHLLPFLPGLFSQGLGELIEFVHLVVKGKGDDASHEKRHGELVGCYYFLQ